MRILKSVLKNSRSLPIQWCEPLTKLKAGFAHSFSVMMGRCRNTELLKIAVFLIIFVTDCLKISQKLKCNILHLVVWNDFEGMQLPITSLRYNSYQYLEPK